MTFTRVTIGVYTVSRAVALFCALSLWGALLSVPPAHAAESTPLAPPALQDLLPDGMDAAEPASAAPLEHAALPQLSVVRGITSVALHATGLLDYLSPFLAQEAGIVIQWRVVDDRRAEALALEGAGDVLLTAMPDRERALVREGRAEQRLEVLSDGYVLAGPAADPANVRGRDILEALRAIADMGAPFVSRGDASPDHKRERTLWKKAERAVRDERNGYREIGQGAPATLALADASGAYVLTSKAAFLTYQAVHGGSLDILIENQTPLNRVWSLLPLAPDREALDKDAAAEALRALTVHALVEWWQKPSTRELAARFTREGQTVFTPFPVLTQALAKGQAPSSAS